MKARIAALIVPLARMMLTLGVGTARAGFDCHTDCYSDSIGGLHCTTHCD